MDAAKNTLLSTDTVKVSPTIAGEGAAERKMSTCEILSTVMVMESVLAR
jgi:hypothetical protein